MIDSVLNEWNNIKSRIEKIEEQQKRFIKYFILQNQQCIDMILCMNNIVYSFFDKIVNNYNLNTTQICDLTYTLYYWESKTDTVLSEYKTYLIIQYLYIVHYDKAKSDEQFIIWVEDSEKFSKQHKYKIEFCMTTDDYYRCCTAFLGYLRSKYFAYLDNKYKQLCQTTR